MNSQNFKGNRCKSGIVIFAITLTILLNYLISSNIMLVFYMNKYIFIKKMSSSFSGMFAKWTQSFKLEMLRNIQNYEI